MTSIMIAESAVRSSSPLFFLVFSGSGSNARRVNP